MVTFSFSIFKSKAKADQRIDALENKTDKLRDDIDRLLSWTRNRYEAMDLVDPMFEKAVVLLKDFDVISVSLLQRKLNTPYTRAAAIFDALKEKGYIKTDAKISDWTVVRDNDGKSKTKVCP